MYNHAILWFFLGIILALFSSSFSLTVNDSKILDDRESVYNVTTKLIDDVNESTFTIKLKCRPRTQNILSCSLYDPEYENLTSCIGEQLFGDVSSYVGNFEIMFRRSIVQQLMVSSSTSLKQLSLYRLIANLLFLGVDVYEKSEGTFSMIEESVYGKCETLVKISRNFRKDDTKETPDRTVSVKRTRNLETCNPIPGFLIFDGFFYHPLMAAVHYDLKSSISRFIVSGNTFTSYTTESIAIKNLTEDNTKLLHVRTTLTQLSLKQATDPIPLIIDPVNVKLSFVEGIEPLNRSYNKTDKKLQTDIPPAMSYADS